MRASFIKLMRPSVKTFMRPTARPLMRPTLRTLQEAKEAPKKKGFLASIPPELYPLYAACFVVCCSATYFSWKHLTHDKNLKLGRKVPQHNEKLEEVLKQSDSPKAAPVEPVPTDSPQDIEATEEAEVITPAKAE